MMEVRAGHASRWLEPGSGVKVRDPPADPSPVSLSWIDNVAVAKKLLGLLVLAALLTALVGAVGYRAVSSVSRDSHELVSDEALPALHLSQTATDLIIMRRHMTSVGLETTAAGISTSQTEITRLRAAVAEGLEAYGASGIADEQRRELEKAQASLAEALRIWDEEIADLAFVPRQTQEQLERLGVLLSTRFRPVANEVRAILVELVAHNLEEVQAGLRHEEQTRDGAVRTIWAVTIAGAVLLMLFGSVLARRITRPLGQVRDALVALAHNDLRSSVTFTSKDEVGSMAQALREAQTGLRGMIETITSSATTIAGSAEELSVATRQLASSAEETTTRSATTFESAEEVSRNVQTVASATEEMTASISEISQSSTQAVRVAGAAVQEAEAVNATVAKLGDSSVEIADVVKVITSIAEQTNLLALNATIEAARAGDAGKGFAVVAEEVKQLAQETSRATEDISRRIEAIQGDSQAAVEAIGRIGVTIEEVNSYQTTIAAAVEEQTATTGEMARSVSDVASGSMQIASNIESVAAVARASTDGVREAERATSELAQLSGELRQLVSTFQV
jgi:methyl-accepting chemotaxis protein